jgi:hypothetical protein
MVILLLYEKVIWVYFIVHIARYLMFEISLSFLR